MNTETNLNEFQKQIYAVRAFLDQGRVLGVDISNDLYEKLDKVIEQQKEHNGRLTVALIGGFSEGKTSLAAAWLGETRANMKINASESSDAVEVYDVDDTLRIVDTPGLFGHKRDTKGEKNVHFKDITRKWVSEANVILYVMNGPNPLKDSHKQELEWFFRELKLLPRTIFVLGRFDEVADMADEAEYNSHLATKRENIISRLNDLIHLTELEKAELSIVAVSANPDGMGMKYWAEHSDEFRALSHIDMLRKAVDDKISLLGGAEKIRIRTIKSVLSDVLARPLLLAEKKQSEVEKIIRQLEECISSGQGDLERIEGRIKAVKGIMKRDIEGLFSSAKIAIQGSRSETLPKIMENEIGAHGEVIEKKIRIMCEDELQPIVRDCVNSLKTVLRAADRAGEAIALDEGEVCNHFTLAGKYTVPAVAVDWGDTVFKIVSSGANPAFSVIGTIIAEWSGPAKTVPVVAQEATGWWSWLSSALSSGGEVATKKVAQDVAAKSVLSKYATLFGALGAAAPVAIKLVEEHQARKDQAKFKELQDTLCTDLLGEKQRLEKQFHSSDFLNKIFPNFGQLREIIKQLHHELKNQKDQNSHYMEWFVEAQKLKTIICP